MCSRDKNSGCHVMDLYHRICALLKVNVIYGTSTADSTRSVILQQTSKQPYTVYKPLLSTTAQSLLLHLPRPYWYHQINKYHDYDSWTGRLSLNRITLASDVSRKLKSWLSLQNG